MNVNFEFTRQKTKPMACAKGFVFCVRLAACVSNGLKFRIRLRLYEYFNYLLTEIPEHMDDKNNDFCEKLLP